MNQDNTIFSSSDHLTPSCPLATKEKPIVAPTIQWVPEMGSFKNEATSCHTADPNMALMEPAMSSSCVELYISTSISPLRMVSLTLAPSRTEPTVSKMLAKMHACRSVTTPEPTAVPKELATSLAPTEKASTKAMMKPSTSIQRKPVSGAGTAPLSASAVTPLGTESMAAASGLGTDRDGWGGSGPGCKQSVRYGGATINKVQN